MSDPAVIELLVEAPFTVLEVEVAPPIQIVEIVQIGPQGPEGPPGGGVEDLPNLTLIFENQLI